MRRASQKGPGATLIVGFDSEYERSDQDRNDVLCLSFAALDPETGAMESGVLPVTDGNDRRQPSDAGGLARQGRVGGLEGRHHAPGLRTGSSSRPTGPVPTCRRSATSPCSRTGFDSPRKTFATTTKPDRHDVAAAERPEAGVRDPRGHHAPGAGGPTVAQGARTNARPAEARPADRGNRADARVPGRRSGTVPPVRRARRRDRGAVHARGLAVSRGDRRHRPRREAAADARGGRGQPAARRSLGSAASTSTPCSAISAPCAGG